MLPTERVSTVVSLLRHSRQVYPEVLEPGDKITHQKRYCSEEKRDRRRVGLEEKFYRSKRLWSRSVIGVVYNNRRNLKYPSVIEERIHPRISFVPKLDESPTFLLKKVVEKNSDWQFQI